MKKFKRLAALMLAALTLFAFTSVVSADELDKNGEYKARLGFQAQTADQITWVQRLGYYDNEDGEKVFTGTYGSDSCIYYEGTFTDAEIKGNGTYTVSYTTTDIASVERFTQLHVATNIPYTEELTFSDLKVSVGGKTIGSYSSVYVDTDSYAGDYCVLLAFNHWRNFINDDTANFDPLCIPTSGDITFSLTFTVSGFDYDNVEQAETETETAADTSNNDNASSDDAKPSGIDSTTIAIVVAAIAVVAIVVIVIVVKKKK